MGCRCGRSLHIFSLVALCENICRHALARASRRNLLVRFYDVLLLSLMMRPDAWDRLCEDAREFRFGAHVAAVLRAVGEMWEPRWPDDLLARLEPRPLAARLARCALRRPRWLGKRGRIALFHACATGGPLAAGRYVINNIVPGIGSFFR